MPLRLQIKLNAKIILKKNWLKASAILLIIYLLCLGLSALESTFAETMGIRIEGTSASLSGTGIIQNDRAFIRYIVAMLPLTGIFTVATILLVTPLFMGMIEWFWRLTDNKPQGISDVFSWFGSFRLYLKSLWMYFNIGLRLLPWLLLCLAGPYALMLYGVYLYDGNSSMFSLNSMLANLCAGGGALLVICGFGVLLFRVGRYYLAPFLLSEDNSRPVNGCVKESLAITRSLRWQIFQFNLTFIGWFLMLLFGTVALSIFVILPAMYVVPYYLASWAVYAKYLIYSDRVKKRQAGEAPGQDTVEFKAQ